MADILKLGSLDLTDDTKWDIEEFGHGPTINRETRSGCGTGRPRTVKRQLSEWQIPLTVRCKTPNGNMTNRDALIAELEKTWDRTQPPIYLERNVDTQTVSDWFTCFDYDFKFERGDLNKKFVTVGVTLKTFPGQQLPEGL